VKPGDQKTTNQESQTKMVFFPGETLKNQKAALLFISFSKRVLAHNLSYGNDFDLQDNERARKSHFHMEDCTPRLFSKPRQQQLEMAYCIPAQTFNSMEIRI